MTIQGGTGGDFFRGENDQTANTTRTAEMKSSPENSVKPGPTWTLPSEQINEILRSVQSSLRSHHQLHSSFPDGVILAAILSVMMNIRDEIVELKKSLRSAEFEKQLQTTITILPSKTGPQSCEQNWSVDTE